MDADTRLLIKVPLNVMALSASYAAALALFERKLHLKPDHEWLEVAVGVGLTLVPVAIEAQAIEREIKHESSEHVSWKTYEHAIWRSFLAAGAPIILWQMGETIVRKLELMQYLTLSDAVRSSTNKRQAEQVIYRNGTRMGGGFTTRKSGYTFFEGEPKKK